MAVTFLTTEDGQAISTQLSNLCIAIAELNRQLDMTRASNEDVAELKRYTRNLYSAENKVKHYESKSYKQQIINEYKDNLLKEKMKA